ncbi:Alkbh3 [Symbiodinium sp. KB8]|nr:Alkbh3 [Symbiodinium sp. KB8]
MVAVRGPDWRRQRLRKLCRQHRRRKASQVRERWTQSLELVGDLAPQGVDWSYPLFQEDWRCFAGYLPEALSHKTRARFFRLVHEGTDWLQPSGRWGPLPLKTAWMCRSPCACKYRYGGAEVLPAPFPDWMDEVMSVCMPLCGLPMHQWPNSCNLNLYMDGQHSVGWHADNEALFQGKVRDCRIISLSLGQSRRFELQCGQDFHRLELSDGDLCTMEGMTQKYYKHRVPKELGIHRIELIKGIIYGAYRSLGWYRMHRVLKELGKKVAARINLTWRWIVQHCDCPCTAPEANLSVVRKRSHRDVEAAETLQEAERPVRRRLADVFGEDQLVPTVDLSVLRLGELNCVSAARCPGKGAETGGVDRIVAEVLELAREVLESPRPGRFGAVGLKLPPPLLKTSASHKKCEKWSMREGRGGGNPNREQTPPKGAWQDSMARADVFFGRRMLEYLAGFFDGDGCVSCVSGLSGCKLVVSQSYDQAEVLMLFREAFCGSIGREHRGMGLRNPKLQWIACGDSARRAARLLAPHSIAKQKQLLIAARWPDSKCCREECEAKLQALKKHDSAVTGPCSWSYFAGFFDAEGCISQSGAGASLVLDVSQKYPLVLKCLGDFLSRCLGIDARFRKARASPMLYSLRTCGMSDCKRILQRMLGAGLLCKAEQAELAQGLTKQNAAQVCAQLTCLTGNQQFGKTLNGAGHERARRIKNKQTQAAYWKRRGRLAEAENKKCEVAVLQEEHEKIGARHENQQLLQYICKLQSLHDNSWNGPLEFRERMANVDDWGWRGFGCGWVFPRSAEMYSHPHYLAFIREDGSTDPPDLPFRLDRLLAGLQRSVLPYLEDVLEHGLDYEPGSLAGALQITTAIAHYYPDATKQELGLPLVCKTLNLETNRGIHGLQSWPEGPQIRRFQYDDEANSSVMNLFVGGYLQALSQGRWRSLLHSGAVLFQQLAEVTKAEVTRDIWTKDFLALPTDSAHVVMEKNHQLRSILKHLHWPRLRSFEVNGKVHDLPFTEPVDGPCRTLHAQAAPPRARLEYLTGFFDGDGTIFAESKRLSGCCVSVGQSVQRAGVLLLFQESFGGSITRHSDGLGLRHPALTWAVGGERARRASHVLATHSITKRKQLLLAADWPHDMHCRRRLNTELRALKRQDSATPRHCTLEYFTGLFDADGCILVTPHGTLSLQIRQKFATVLECLRDFLARDFGVDAQVKSYGSITHLSMGRTSSCKHVLQAMLRAGLHCKAEQAQLALGLTPHNAAEVRASMSELVGNQTFAKKLDEDGLHRFRLIRNAQRQATRWKRQGNLADANTKLQDIAAMKTEHERCNVQLENLQLSEYIRKIQYLHLPASRHCHTDKQDALVPEDRLSLTLFLGIPQLHEVFNWFGQTKHLDQWSAGARFDEIQAQQSKATSLKDAGETLAGGGQRPSQGSMLLVEELQRGVLLRGLLAQALLHLESEATVATANPRIRQSEILNQNTNL